MQVTERDLEIWRHEPARYLSEEVHDPDSVRGSAADVLDALLGSAGSGDSDAWEQDAFCSAASDKLQDLAAQVCC